MVRRWYACSPAVTLHTWCGILNLWLCLKYKLLLNEKGFYHKANHLKILWRKQIKNLSNVERTICQCILKHLNGGFLKSTLEELKHFVLVEFFLKNQTILFLLQLMCWYIRCIPNISYFMYKYIHPKSVVC